MSKRIVDILMERDEMTEEEAEELIKETQEEIDAALGNNDYDAVEDIIADMLGLELDYAIDLLM